MGAKRFPEPERVHVAVVHHVEGTVHENSADERMDTMEERVRMRDEDY